MSAEHAWAVPDTIYEQWTAECNRIAVLTDISKIRHASIAENVFDHVNITYAQKYLEFATEYLTAAQLHACVSAASAWDEATGGRLNVSVEGARISNTACKYIALVAKMCFAFGGVPKHIVEIGGGLGGFAYIMRTLGCQVTVVDLPASIRALANIFAHMGAGERITCISGEDRNALSTLPYGFTAVSEHAWSECPRTVREMYADCIFKKSSAGWLTCNATVCDPTCVADVETLVAPRKVTTHPSIFSSDRSWAVSWKAPPTFHTFGDSHAHG